MAIETDYKQEMKDNLKRAEKKYKLAYEKCVKDPSLENIDAMNLASVDVKTAKSRMANFGKDRGGLEEIHLPSNIRTT